VERAEKQRRPKETRMAECQVLRGSLRRNKPKNRKKNTLTSKRPKERETRQLDINPIKCPGHSQEKEATQPRRTKSSARQRKAATSRAT